MTLDRLLDEAFKRRVELHEAPCRLFDGHGDGLDGLFIEGFGEFLLVKLFSGSEAGGLGRTSVIQGIEKVLSNFPRYKSCYLCEYSRGGGGSEGARRAELVIGPPVPELIIEEGEMRFLLRPERNLNAGFFTDMREVRRWVLGNSAGLRVLNLFSFTGAFSVAAYCGKAAEVVNVDISRSVLRWGEENISLNKSDSRQGVVKFINDHAPAYLSREVRRTEGGKTKWDIVILDPPLVGLDKRGRFSFDRDIAGILTDCFKVLSAGGALIFTCNSRNLSIDDLTKMVAKAVLLLERSSKGNKVIGEVAVDGELWPPQEDFSAHWSKGIGMKGLRITKRRC